MPLKETIHIALKESAIAKATKIVNESYGYHTGDVIDYDTVVEMLADVFLEQNQRLLEMTKRD